jgi:hypothetical protein
VGDGGVNLSGPFEPERVEAIEVSANFFQTLGVSPLFGRTFSPEEEQPGKQMVAVISYELWQRELGGAVDPMGATLALNGKSFTIIGVAPPGFLYPRKVSLWIPLAPLLSERIFTNPGIQYNVFGRLKEGVTPEQANSETVAAVRSYPPPEQPGRASSLRPIKVVPLLDHLVGDIRKVLALLLGSDGDIADYMRQCGQPAVGCRATRRRGKCGQRAQAPADCSGKRHCSRFGSGRRVVGPRAVALADKLARVVESASTSPAGGHNA